MSPPVSDGWELVMFSEDSLYFQTSAWHGQQRDCNGDYGSQQSPGKKRPELSSHMKNILALGRRGMRVDLGF